MSALDQRPPSQMTALLVSLATLGGPYLSDPQPPNAKSLGIRPEQPRMRLERLLTRSSVPPGMRLSRVRSCPVQGSGARRDNRSVVRWTGSHRSRHRLPWRRAGGLQQHGGPVDHYALQAQFGPGKAKKCRVSFGTVDFAVVPTSPLPMRRAGALFSSRMPRSDSVSADRCVPPTKQS
jgi:hypothetical protein